MNNFIVLPLAGAAVAICFGYFFYYVALSSLKKNKKKLLHAAISVCKQQLNSQSSVHMQQLMPLIEAKIDAFLTTKLPARMPVIAMFTGERTNAQLKEVFTEELEEIFPEVMNSYMDSLSSNATFKGPAKLNNVNRQSVFVTLLATAGFTKTNVALACGVAGFIIGLVCAAIISVSRL